MTPAEALAMERRWGAPGPPPENGWRCCRRCADYYPPEARFWCDPAKRLCRGCKADERRGIWPLTRRWHQKNRWTIDGHLVRRCTMCRTWHPLTAFYLLRKNDKPGRTCREYAVAACIRCMCARKALHLSTHEYRRRLAA